MTAAGWRAMLDELEVSVAEVERALAEPDAVPVLAPWKAPTSLGPCPPDLLERAHTVARSIFEAERALGDRVERVGRDLHAATAHRARLQRERRGGAYGGLDLGA